MAYSFLFTNLSQKSSNGVPYVVIKDKNLFTKLDKGGSVCKLSSDSFGCDLNKGMGGVEWTSKENVKPIDKVNYDSTLTAMLDNGLQVYFIDNYTFNRINNFKIPEEVIELINWMV